MKKDINQSSKDAINSLVAKKRRSNKIFRLTRLSTAIVLGLFGFIAVLSSCFFLGRTFVHDSYTNSSNPYFYKTGQIVVKFDSKDPAHPTKVTAQEVKNDVQQNINSLFSAKQIDKKWKASQISVSIVSSNAVQVSGPSELIDKLKSIYKLWTTNDSNITLTDQLGDRIYAGINPSMSLSNALNDPTQSWFAHLFIWSWDHSNKGSSDGVLHYNNTSAAASNQYQALLNSPDILSANGYVKSFWGTPLDSSVFSSASSTRSVQYKNGKADANNPQNYSLSFTLSNTQKFTNFSKYLYSITKGIYFDATKDGKKLKNKTSDFKSGATNAVFTNVDPVSENDATITSNAFIHTFLFFWYGKAPNLNNQYVAPSGSSKSTSVIKTYFEGSKSAPSVLSINPISSDSLINYERNKGNIFNSNVSELSQIKKDYWMTYDKNSKTWEGGKLIGLYSIDYTSGFASGLSGTLSFANASPKAGGYIGNNFAYPIFEDYSKKDNTDSKKNKDSSNATTNLANQLRPSLGDFATSIFNITYIDPILFAFKWITAFVIGILVIFLGFGAYLIFRRKLLGLMAFLGFVSFVFGIMAILYFFKLNLTPTYIPIIIISFLLMAINTYIITEWLQGKFKVPSNVTLVEAIIARAKKIAGLFFKFNLPVFITLYLSFGLITSSFQGPSLLWLATLLEITVISIVYLLIVPISLLEHSLKLRNKTQLLGIDAQVESQEQIEEVYFYSVSKEEVKEETAEEQDNILFHKHNPMEGIGSDDE